MASPAQNEPTMEEILASIRKIIASDPVDKPSAQSAPANNDDDGVLELTDPIGDTQSGNSLNAASHSGAQTDITDDIIFETIEEPPMSSDSPTASAARNDQDIFSDKTRQAMDNTFAELDKPMADTPSGAAAHDAPAPKMPSGDSIQAVFERAIHTGFEPMLREHLNSNTDVIIERMKPLIRDWMDEHFPALLEGAVRNEVARVVKARGR